MSYIKSQSLKSKFFKHDFFMCEIIVNKNPLLFLDTEVWWLSCGGEFINSMKQHTTNRLS